ncbi:Tripartite tricarboxylate transporter family receptor [Hartmannibacter diazotrophicus]|uniref:Tripartite tricarboxylate transporter family receptor n=1 Tax=Hartmannibacter diazotrophicus TaxID=1482074 RepID=A0A2C9DBZ6_9HYPH|nr:tripartite tricarboxylate transporter substrate binding protein [Hartmannibacter diazotrophicus]SON57763.1 Tripartite tricarboxylate transporter family receptor [Hartmannibacter diazotrophicus]
MTKWKTWAVAALVGAAAAVSSAHAEFPNDGEITFVIPYNPGGGFDTIVRAYIPALQEVLGATVVPQNISGASGTRGGQAVYRADPDGYTIGIFNIPGLTVSEAMDRKIGFDLDKVTWIANLAEEQYAIAVKTDSPYKSTKDLCALGRPIKLSDTGKDSTSSITAVITFDMMGCPITNIAGYGGSNDTMIAVMRGEVDATLKPISSLSKYVDSGDLRIITTLTDKPVLEGVETTTDLGYPDVARFTINRVVGGPPDMPADVVKTLQDAFAKATESADVQAWAKGSNTRLQYRNAADTKAMMDDLSTFYAAHKALLSGQ